MSQPSTINDCMRHNPLTIKGDVALVEAIENIVEYKLTGLSVVDENNSVIGALTELDCMQAILTSIYHNDDPGYLLVKDAMNTQTFTCKPTNTIIEVAQTMLDARQRRSAVIENNKLVGQVSSSNILWALMEHSRSRMNERKK